MLISNIRLFLFQKLLFVGTTIGLLIIVLISTVYYKNLTHNHHIELLVQQNSITQDLSNLKSTKLRYKENYLLWQKHFSKLYIAKDDINLEYAEKVIQNLQNLYQFKNFQINVTNLQHKSGLSNYKFETVQYSILKFNFESTSDQNVLKFINDLSNKLDGSISVTKLKIQLNDQIQSPSNANYITVSIEMLWQNLFDREIQ